MRVLIRADATPLIGSGHLIRTRSLARALRSLGADIRFCGRIPEGDFLQAFSREFLLIPLPPEGQSVVDPVNQVWLPVSEAEDVRLTLSAFQQELWRPDWVVVDHYGLSVEWHQALRIALPDVRLAVIDDLADRLHDPDLLLDHNIFHGELARRYTSLLPIDREVKLCLGPEFALIDPFHAGFQGALPPRRELRRLLISLGGAGDSQLLENVLNTLAAMPGPSLQLHLVEGGFAQHNSTIHDLCEQLDVQRHRSLPTLAPLMATADAAIGAGGTTTWERFCLGLPSITYALAANQQAYSRVLADMGLIEYMGMADDFCAEALLDALRHWQYDPTSLQRQSRDGMALVDGQGCVRVARLMASQLDSDWLPGFSSPADGYRACQWPDGLSLTPFVSEPASVDGVQIAQSGPLRVLDRLEINRRSHEPGADFLRSAGVLPLASPQRVTVLSARGSWMNRYIPELLEQARQLGCSLRWIHDHQHLSSGDVCFFLSYERIVGEQWLALHRHNLVVHASDLPRGKGWSPMTWQILEGSSTIPLTLFEASADLDAGAIHAQVRLELEGHELAAEWQALQAAATVQLCSMWLQDFPESAEQAQTQQGQESCYSRRRPSDSRLDPTISLVDQFSLLRVVDNHAYPAFFEWQGRRYRLQIQPWS